MKTTRRLTHWVKFIGVHLNCISVDASHLVAHNLHHLYLSLQIWKLKIFNIIYLPLVSLTFNNENKKGISIKIISLFKSKAKL